MAKLVIGLGTGRCGTRSLTKMLNQNGVCATHEKYFRLWQPNEAKALSVIEKMIRESTKPVVADVAFYWLSYIDIILREYPDTKFVCLKRAKEKVVASFMRSLILPVCYKIIFSQYRKSRIVRMSEYVRPEDFETMDASTREWVLTYWDEPFIDDVDFDMNDRDHGHENRINYLNNYWDDYYETAEPLQGKYPDSFMIADMHETLNTEAGKSKIFNFIGIAPEAAVQ